MAEYDPRPWRLGKRNGRLDNFLSRAQIVLTGAQSLLMPDSRFGAPAKSVRKAMNELDRMGYNGLQSTAEDVAKVENAADGQDESSGCR